MKVASIILAAGKSERMGENKLLMDFKGKKLLEHVLDALEESAVDEIIIVLGNKPWEIIDAIKSRQKQIKTVVNERFEEGMTSSFKAGFKEIQDADAALLVLGDQLILDPTLINVMIKVMEESNHKAMIISPVHKGKKGHPVLFSEKLFNEILDLKENEVIGDILHKHSDILLCIEAEQWTVMDIDTPKDYDEAKRLLEQKSN